jgi:phosphoglycerate dehydrogenase-like enzyme
MPQFRVLYTGDYLDDQGNLSVPDIALDLYAETPWISHDFIRRQQPKPGDAAYWSQLYSLDVKPEDLDGAQGLVIFRPWVKASTFSGGAEALVAIGRAGAGCDKIDIAACTENDVVLFNAPDTLTHATASSAFLLMLALAKRLPEQERIVRQGRWHLQAATMGDDLPGKTLAIIGLGRSGVELARMARAFHMLVLAYSPQADKDTARSLGVTLVGSLEEALRPADFVSLHCRLTPDRRGMIGRRELSWLKTSAYFINVARGELVDQEELVRLLQERRIAGAGLDVFEHEPLPIDDPLNKLNNVILTPHWLPSTRQAARLTMETMSLGMIAASQGRVPENVVNPEVLTTAGFRRKLERFTVNASVGGSRKLSVSHR